MIEALKLACEAFAMRFHRTGINHYENAAWIACREHVKKETGEVLNHRTMKWEKPI